MQTRGTLSLYLTFTDELTMMILQVSKIFDLNFRLPKIVDSVLSGTQPRTLKLRDITSVKFF